MTVLSIDDSEWRQLALAYGDIGSGKLKTGLRRGINQAGNKGRTPAVRATAAHADVPQKLVRSALSTYPARGSKLSYRVTVRAKHLKLIDLGGARQTGSGVSVRRWGAHKGAFLATMRSGHTGIYRRVSKKRLPIAELYGPNVAKSFDKEGAEVFLETAGQVLVPFIYKRLDGVVAQAGRRRGVLR
jgi:hypothetical protein